MAEPGNPFGPLTETHILLGTYIKKRQEAAHIRKILSAHLNTHLGPSLGALSRPLSLTETTYTPETISHGIKGVHKEYLRSVLAHVKAQLEYNKISEEHLSSPNYQEANKSQLSHASAESSPKTLDAFLALIKSRQRHDRLRIIHNYVDVLGGKTLAAGEYLDPRAIPDGITSLPQLPPEVLNISHMHQAPEDGNIKELVGRLEKSVLRAKMFLKREQKLLAKVQSENRISSVSDAGRMQALGTTRNELISWIESELSRAGKDIHENKRHDSFTSGATGGKTYIDNELTSIRRQYRRYTNARQSLMAAVTGKLCAPAVRVADDCEDTSRGPGEPSMVKDLVSTTQLYLEEMVRISNEQKAIIQQKSHLTISLAKQLKESVQGLDRLADESHLLPAHPMPTVRYQRRGFEGQVLFGDEISGHEKPIPSRRACTWAFAGDMATNETRDIVSEKLEDGGTSMLSAQEALVDLLRLLGHDTEEENLVDDDARTFRDDKSNSGDIWTVLDGKLGVIEREGVDTT